MVSPLATGHETIALSETTVLTTTADLDGPVRRCHPAIEGDVHPTTAVTEVHDASSYG